MKIQNLVASVDLKTKIPLNEILANLEEAEYEPEQFPGLVYRLQEPRVSSLIFQSGKIISLGNKSKADAKKAIDKIIQKLRKIGVPVPRKYQMKIVNIVVTDDLGRELDLGELAFQLEESEYEPEQFPGLVYRIFDPKVSFLLFSSGRIVCAGAKTMGEVRTAIEKLKKRLRKI